MNVITPVGRSPRRVDLHAHRWTRRSRQARRRCRLQAGCLRGLPHGGSTDWRKRPRSLGDPPEPSFPRL